MKRILLTFVLVVFAATAFAEGNPKKPSWAGFVSNGFWSNWELSGGAGVQTATANGKVLGPLGQRLGFEGNISALKWVHPVMGARLQFQGGYFNNYDAQYGKMEWPYLFTHVDFMVNLSNWIGGYRDDRAYYAVPFAGFGYMVSNFTDESQRYNHSGTRQNFVFAYGILNKFRLSPSVDFNIELKGLVGTPRLSPASMGGSYMLGFSATAGFTYRFKTRGWQRAPIGFTAQDIRALQEAVATQNSALESAKAENARLNSELGTARADADAAKAAAAAAPKQVAAPKEKDCPVTWTILYGLGEWQLTPREQTRLDLVANRMKDGSKDKVYTIVGHADRETGTPAINQRLSEQRAKTVYNYLISKGVPADQLKYEALGDTQSPYNFPKANRSVIVK